MEITNAPRTHMQNKANVPSHIHTSLCAIGPIGNKQAEKCPTECSIQPLIFTAPLAWQMISCSAVIWQLLCRWTSIQPDIQWDRRVVHGTPQ